MVALPGTTPFWNGLLGAIETRSIVPNDFRVLNIVLYGLEYLRSKFQGRNLLLKSAYLPNLDP